MATEMHWYNGGTWKKALEMHVWDSGTSSWREAIRMYIYDESIASWRLCHVSPNACFSFNGDDVTFTSPCCLAACAGGNNTTYYSNCTDPYTDFNNSVVCYIYNDSACVNGIADSYIQLNIGGTQYNFDTDFAGQITAAAVVTC